MSKSIAVQARNGSDIESILRKYGVTDFTLPDDDSAPTEAEVTEDQETKLVNDPLITYVSDL